MGSNGRNSGEDRKLEGGMSEKQSGLPPPASASEPKSSGLHPSIYIAYVLLELILHQIVERTDGTIEYGYA